MEDQMLEPLAPLYDRRLAAGLCGGCGRCPPAAGTPLCAPCTERARLNTAAHRAKQQAAGLCNRGGCDQPPVPGKRKCQVHLDLCSREQGEKSKARVAAGLCRTNNCPRPLVAGCQYCAYHRAQVNERSKRQYEAKKAAKAAAAATP